MTYTAFPPRRISWYVAKVDGTLDVTCRDPPLTQALWEEFCNTVQVTAELRTSVIDFLALEADYGAFSMVPDQLQDAWRLDPLPLSLAGRSAVVGLFVAQRHLSNFLAAASAFRDRVSARLNRSSTQSRAALASFTAQTRDEYDNHFAYRVMYNLRNHAQHHDSPISLIPFRYSAPTGTAKASHQITIKLRLTELCENSRLQKKFLAELKSRSEHEIDLLPLATEFMASHARLMAILLSHYEPSLERLERFAQFVAQLAAEADVPKDAVPAVIEGDFPVGGSASRNFTLCGFDELELIRDIQKRLPPPVE